MSNETPGDGLAIQLPRSIEELEYLIKQFYGLNTPQQYKNIDTCLKAVQTKHGAFTLADQLMNSTDDHVRFFAALTFVVQINRNWTDLNPSQGQDLLNRVLFWFVHCVNTREASIVTRKLCAALVAIFKQATRNWTFCLKHSLACLLAGSVVDYQVAAQQDSIMLVQRLSTQQVQACLWLGSALVEDVNKNDYNASQSAEIQGAISLNVPTLLDLIEHCLSIDDGLVQDAVKLLHTLGDAWAQHFGADNSDAKERLSKLVLLVVSHLTTNEHFSATTDLATDLINKGSDRQLAQLLAAKVIEDQFAELYRELQDGNFHDDALIYGRLLISIATTWVEDISTKKPWHTPSVEEILNRLVHLAGSEGYPVEDDTLIPDVLIFWSDYVEWAADLTSYQDQSSETLAMVANTKEYTSRVLEALLKKLQIPPSHVLKSWEPTMRAELTSLRRDFRDFSATAFTLLGINMLETLINILLRLWSEATWSGVDVTLQCMKGVIESVVDTEDGDTALLSYLYSDVYSSDTTIIPPVGTQEASIDMLSSLGPVFERQTHAPTAILEWLFQKLNTPSLAWPAARAITQLCRTNRVKLVHIAQELVDRWNLLVNGDADHRVIEKLASAVGAIVQAKWAQSSPKNNANHGFSESRSAQRRSTIRTFDSLLNVLYDQLTATGIDGNLETKERRMTLLQSLANISREFQDEFAAVDLDEPEESNKSTDADTKAWKKQQYRRFAQYLANILQAYPQDGELMEVVCLLCRGGTTSHEDNPFELDQNVLTCLVSTYLQATPRPGELLGTVSRYIRSESSNLTGGPSIRLMTEQGMRFANVAGQCLQSALELLKHLDSTTKLRDNFDHVSAILVFAATFIPKDVDVVMGHSQLQNWLVYAASIAIYCFTVPEADLKIAAGPFWAALLDLRLPSSTISNSEPDLQSAILPLIPSLMHALVMAISGNAARSDLDVLIIPFRRLVIYPIPRTQSDVSNIKTLLWSSLTSDSFPSQRVGERDKKMFMEKLIRLRGEASGTGKVVKEWWVTCRGTFS